MDDSRGTGQPGHVEPTPEARPTAAGPTPAGGTERPEPEPLIPQDRPDDIGRDVADRLKPVAAAAEGIAAKAVDLSTKGLGKLAAMLEERRRQRQGGDESR